MSIKILTFLCISIFLLLRTSLAKPPQISSFKKLAEYHCQQFPIEILYRLSSGTLAEKYGSQYAQIDCYVRQFVNEDGKNLFQNQRDDQEDEYQSSSQNEEQQSTVESFEGQQQKPYIYPEVDPVIQKYAEGIENCLPKGADPIAGTYKIWRFYRFVFQHDYAFQWMRAKIRSNYGYQAEKPNAWIDGEQAAKRLRLDKLFSNQFYSYVGKLMFKDFLFPLMTFLKKNVVVGLQGSQTSSGKPMIIQYIESRNILPEIFKGIVFLNDETGNQIFTYTLPGIPLFLGGSSVDFMWAFTGVLIDRSNIEQIQTVGNKFYHHDVQMWIPLTNITMEIEIKDQLPKICTFMHSSYGTLYEKHNQTGKVSEYIVKWHENQPKVRNLFSEVYNLIKNTGKTERNFDFPFNSILMGNQSGLFHYICQQQHPSYFIFPDMIGQPERIRNRWVSNPNKGVFAIVNTHLTTTNQKSYLNKQTHNPSEEQIITTLRQQLKQKIDLNRLWRVITSLSTDSLIKKRKQILIFIYRKAKFAFFPEENIRKQCDQLITILEKWNDNLDSELHSPVFLLWDYFFREFTFNHVSSSKYGSYIVKHKILTDSYWTGQPDLWKKVISYGQCDSNEWYSEGWNVRLNNTNLNCTCFFNIFRALNKTRQILRNQDGSINQNLALSPLNVKKTIDLTEKYIGTQVEEAFSNFYSKNLGFTAELYNPKISYLSTYKQLEDIFTLSYNQKAQKSKQAKQSEISNAQQKVQEMQEL